MGVEEAVIPEIIGGIDATAAAPEVLGAVAAPAAEAAAIPGAMSIPGAFGPMSSTAALAEVPVGISPELYGTMTGVAPAAAASLAGPPTGAEPPATAGVSETTPVISGGSPESIGPATAIAGGSTPAETALQRAGMTGLQGMESLPGTIPTGAPELPGIESSVETPISSSTGEIPSNGGGGFAPPPESEGIPPEQTPAPVETGMPKPVTPISTTTTGQDLATLGKEAVTSPLSAIQRAISQRWSKDPLGTLAQGAGLASGLYGMTGGARQAQKYLAGQTGKMEALGKPATDVGTQLLSSYQSGNLSPADSMRIDQWATQQKAQTRDYFSKSGLSDSPMAIQAMQQVDQQAEQMRQQALQNMMKSGLSALQVGAGPIQSAIQAQIAGDRGVQQQQSDFLRALASLGAGGQSTPQTPQQTTPNV